MDKEKVLNNAIKLLRVKSKVTVRGYDGFEDEIIQKNNNVHVRKRSGFFELKLM